MTRINTDAIVWNTAMTFGVGIVSCAATLAIKKIAHHYFGNENRFFISIGALLAGMTVAHELTSRVTIMTFPFDKRFRDFHSLHVLLTFAFDGLAAMMLYEKKTDNAMIFGSIGTLFVLTFLAGIDTAGSKLLPIAGILGVVAGVYPYQKC